MAHVCKRHAADAVAALRTINVRLLGQVRRESICVFYAPSIGNGIIPWNDYTDMYGVCPFRYCID